MKNCNLILSLIGALLIVPSLCQAQPNAPGGPSGPPQQSGSGDDKRARNIINALHLDDAAKEAKIKEIVIAHAEAQRSWHQTNDAQIKGLWDQFNKARSQTNQPKADEVIGQIDAVYAGFKPEHEAFISKLATQLTPEQIETVKDVMTVNKVEVTYKNYLLIFHGLTAEQKDFILKNLKAAREEAMDAAEIKREGSAFFKKYKIKIEAYLTAQGYDVKKSYQEFVAKVKAGTVGQDAEPADAKKSGDK